MKRRVQSLPCPHHGHPAQLLPHLRAWINFYNLIAPYSTSQTLDHILISKICADYHLRFTEAFFWLTVIHGEARKKYDKGDRASEETDARESKGFQKRQIL